MANETSLEELDTWIARQKEMYEAGYISAKDLADAQKDYAAGVKGYTANLKQSMAQLGTSFNEMGKTIYDGKQGAAVYNSTLSSGADAVAAYALKFGPAGVALGFFTKAVIGFVNAALKQSDSLYDSYVKISRTGTVGSQAMGEVFSQMKAFGYTVEQLGDMGSLLAQNSKSFGTFSKSALAGARQFGDVANSIQNSPIRDQFFRLGMSVNDINDGIAGYVNQQGKLGLLQGKTTKELTDGSQEYIKQLDLLTKLTGMTRQEQEDAREQALQIEAFYAGLADLDPDAQEQAMQAYTQALRKGGPKFAAEMAANFNGVITGASDAFLSTGGESMKYFGKEFFARGGTADQAMAGVAGSITPAMAEVTKGLNQLGGGFGLNLRTIKQLQGGIDPLAKTTEQLAEEQKNQLAGVNPATKAQAGIRDAQIKSSQNLSEFTNLGVNPATQALEIFTDVVEFLTSLLPGSGRAKQQREDKQAAAQAAAVATQGVAVSGSAEAKASAEKYLGKAISDDEFSALIKATHAEAAGGKQASQQEQAMIMASVLNRARTDKGGIMGALTAKNQFQSVTGTANAPGPSQQYLQGPEKDRLQSIEGATKLLENISTQQKNFTAADSAAYGPGTNISYRDKMLAAGGTTIGGTVFQTAPRAPRTAPIDYPDYPSAPDFGGMPMADGGILSGPISGYKPNLTMHGTEAIVPLNTPAQQAAAMGGMDNSMQVAQLDKLDEMIDIMRNQLGVQTKQMQLSS